MRTLAWVVAMGLACGATAAPILVAPLGAEFSLRAQNAADRTVRICWVRVEVEPPEELSCVDAVGPGETAQAVAVVPYTPTRDAEIRAQACDVAGAPGVHPEAACSALSADHYPIRMTSPAAPVLLGP